MSSDGVIDLYFRPAKIESEFFVDHTLWVDVAYCDTDNPTTLFFDMADWPSIASLEALDDCDFYIKRSYSHECINRLPRVYSSKIKPFGLYFPCRSDVENRKFSFLFMRLLSKFHYRRRTRVTYTEIIKALMKHCLALSGLKRFYSEYPALSQFASSRKSTNVVMYQVRIWDPVTTKSFNGRSVNEINQFRIELVRKLKAGLGPSFVGGVIDSALSRKLCPGLISPLSSDSKAYFDLVDRASIVVADTGLHNSTGAKFAEYFAFGKCILSEPLVYSVARAPRSGVDFLEYRDADHCVALCQLLLNNSELRLSLMERSRDYYVNYGSPEKQLSQLFASLGITLSN
ncbi:hypothetical protein A3765_16010 [Oleiphilus sp. HI0130]|nr:hypothetical protein A3765_16010 [Oleiphilus sp. HI0130]